LSVPHSMADCQLKCCPIYFSILGYKFVKDHLTNE
jgi:hypothetical protein